MIPGTQWREAHGLEILYLREIDLREIDLGEIDVGRVDARGGKGNGPRWIFNLNLAQSFWISAGTLDEAKAEVEARLEHWLKRAGLLPAPDHRSNDGLR